MSDSVASGPADAGPADEQVSCSKCGAANPKSGRRCVECGAHMYVRCRQCRRRNERAAVTCVACGQPMSSNLKRGFLRENVRAFLLTAGVILFLVLGVLIANHFTPLPVQPKPPGQVVKVPVSTNDSQRGAVSPRGK